MYPFYCHYRVISK